MDQATSCIAWANDGEWHSILLSASGLRLRLVIDNQLVGTTTLSGVPIDDASMSLVTVGVRAPGTFWYRGQMSHARLYYRAVTYESPV